MQPHARSIGRRLTAALVTLALMLLTGSTGWAVAEMEGAEEAAAAPTGEVARSAFTREIVDREPVDQVTVLENDTTRIYFFSELVGLEGETVMHQWEYNGEVMAVVPFEVGGPRWRVNSSKELDPGRLGEWTVRVILGEGNELGVDRFTYTKAEPTPAAPSSLQVD